MEGSSRQRLKEYLHFLKKDRVGILVLTMLIVLAIAGHLIVGKLEINPQYDYTEIIKTFEAWEKEKEKQTKNKNEALTYFYFNPNIVSKGKLDSFDIPKFVKNNIISYRAAGGKFTRPSDIKKIYGMNDSLYDQIKPWLLFPEAVLPDEKKMSFSIDSEVKDTFNPNTVTADELTGYGFNKFQISNLEKYRKKGGKFYKPADIMKIYGVDTDLFHAVKKYIRLDEITLNTYEEKLPEVLQVELNSADSLELVRLKGIGPVFASRILKYRNLLGGFYTTDQLLEVYGFPEATYQKLERSFMIDTLKLIKIRVNFAEYSELIRHPYLEKKDVEAILNYRNNNGPFLSNTQLLSSGLIDSVAYKSLKPYLTCR